MKNPMSKAFLFNAKNRMTIVLKNIKRAFYLSRSRYQALNKQQRMVLFFSVIIILLLLMAFGDRQHVEQEKRHRAYPVAFETRTATKSPLIISQPVVAIKKNNTKLQAELNQLNLSSREQLATLRSQLDAIESNMSSLASQQDMQQLQHTVNQPNKILLGKVNHLQRDLQTIAQQTAKKVWVNPKTVEQYFRLIAVQGFSDGMRAIIEVNGNQMTLSTHEICPACRGWVLQRMDFANQRAIFAKQTHGQTQYVTLQAN